MPVSLERQRAADKAEPDERDDPPDAGKTLHQGDQCYVQEQRSEFREKNEKGYREPGRENAIVDADKNDGREGMLTFSQHSTVNIPPASTSNMLRNEGKGLILLVFPKLSVTRVTSTAPHAQPVTRVTGKGKQHVQDQPDRARAVSDRNRDRMRNSYCCRLFCTATATATVAPTMGLFPMPRKPIISTCAGTEEEPANWASECMRPMVSVMP